VELNQVHKLIFPACLQDCASLVLFCASSINLVSPFLCTVSGVARIEVKGRDIGERSEVKKSSIFLVFG